MAKKFKDFSHDFIVNETFQSFVGVCKQYNVRDSFDIEKLKDIWTYLCITSASDTTIFEANRYGEDLGDDDTILSDVKDALDDGKEALKKLANKSIMAVMSAASLAMYFFKRKKVLKSLKKEDLITDEIFGFQKEISDYRVNDANGGDELEKAESNVDAIRDKIEKLKGLDDEVSVKKRKIFNSQRSELLDSIEQLKSKKGDSNALNIEKAEAQIKSKNEEKGDAKIETDLIVGENPLLQKLAAKNRLESDLNFSKKMRTISTEAEVKILDKKIQAMEKLAAQTQTELNDVVTASKKEIPEKDLDKELADIEKKEAQKKSEEPKKEEDKKDAPKDDKKKSENPKEKKSEMSDKLAALNKTKTVDGEAPEDDTESEETVATEPKKAAPSGVEKVDGKKNPQIIRLEADLDKEEKEYAAMEDDLEALKKSKQKEFVPAFTKNLEDKQEAIDKIKKQIEALKNEQNG
jgi:hypothetical protein